MRKKTPPTLRKEFNLDIWTVRAIKLYQQKEKFPSETELVKRTIDTMLKVKPCPFATSYAVDKKKREIRLFCKQFGNWIDFEDVCLKTCLDRELKTGYKKMEAISVVK